MIKRYLDSAFLVVLGVALFALLAVILLPFFSDWVVDIWGEKKEKIVEIVGWGIVSILALWGEVKGGIWMAARSKSADAQNGSMKKKKTIGRKVKASRRKVRVLWRKMKAIWQKIMAVWQCVKACVNWVRQNWLSVFLVIVGAVLFVVLVLVMFDECIEYWAMDVLGVSDKDGKQEVIKFIGLGIAGVLAVFGSVAVGKRANAQVKNNELVEKGHVQERFKSAVEHLGSKQVAARIASFYEFSYLARDNENLRRNIFDILCAHLRQATADKEYKEEIGFIDESGFADGEGDNSEVRPTEEVQSLLDVLFQKSSQEKLIFEGFKSNLRRILLMGTNLQEANLHKADLHEANLQRANLHKADLRHADLQNADLQNAVIIEGKLDWANLYKANLQKANLYKANLQKVNLRLADLQGANLYHAVLVDGDLGQVDLRGADLDDADLRGVNFNFAKLQEARLQFADLRGANLWGIDLQGADLRGADLRDVRNLNRANLSEVKINEAKFPAGYNPPDDAIVTNDKDDPFPF